MARLVVELSMGSRHQAPFTVTCPHTLLPLLLCFINSCYYDFFIAGDNIILVPNSFNINFRISSFVQMSAVNMVSGTE